MRKISISLILILGICLLNCAILKKHEKEAVADKPVQAALKQEEAIQVKKIEPFYYCAVEMTGSYQQHPAAFQTLYAQAAYQQLNMDQVSFGIYWNDPAKTPVEELRWEIGFAVPEGQKIKAPLKLKKWEFTLVVSKKFEGPYGSEEMENIYAEIFKWIEKNGYMPTGPAMEKYLSMPEQNAEGQWCGKVEIMVPVKKL